MVMISSCLGLSKREMLGGIYGQEQRNQVQKGKSVEAKKYYTSLDDDQYPEKNINNHHNIPRQDYNSGDSSNDGSG